MKTPDRHSPCVTRRGFLQSATAIACGCAFDEASQAAFFSATGKEPVVTRGWD